MLRPINRTTDTANTNTHTHVQTYHKLPAYSYRSSFYWQWMCHFWEGWVGVLTGNGGDLTPNPSQPRQCVNLCIVCVYVLPGSCSGPWHVLDVGAADAEAKNHKQLFKFCFAEPARARSSKSYFYPDLLAARAANFVSEPHFWILFSHLGPFFTLSLKSHVTHRSDLRRRNNAFRSHTARGLGKYWPCFPNNEPLILCRSR